VLRRTRRHIDRIWAASTVLLVAAGAAASLLGAHAVARNQEQDSNEALRESAAEIASRLNLAILHEEDLVVGAGGFVVGHPHARSTQFGQWARSVRALERYPEMRGFGYVVRVPAAQLAAFAAAIGRDPAAGGARLRVMPPGKRPFYCLIVGGVGRGGASTFPVGFDFCATAPVGPSALAARDSGTSAYVPTPLKKGMLLAVYVPVYRRGVTPTTVAARRAAFLGWIGVSLVPTVVLDQVLTGHPHTALAWRYHPGPSNTVFRSGAAPRGARSITTDLHNGWTVRTSAAVYSGGILGSWSALAVLTGGLVLTVLVALLIAGRRRRAEAQTEERVLRESEQRLDALLHNSSDVITVVAADATVLYQADSVLCVLGHAPGELVGANLRDWVDPADVPLLLSLCRTTEPADAELNVRHADGGLRACEVRATSLLDNPAWRGVVLNIRDVSQRKRLEVELRLAQKLESVGQLAAGIAHEINTPIQYVSSSVDFLDRAFADMAHLHEAHAALAAKAARAGVDREALAKVAAAEEAADLEYLRERVPGALQRSREGLERVAKIVGAMRVLGHPSGHESTPVDINGAIENTLIVAASEYRYVADVTTELGDLPLIRSKGNDIHQVLINLIINASHAIADVVGDSGERGAIHICTSVDVSDVLITIADTGGGIPAEINDRVFDPFFTTKEVGKGTGQGLAIARMVIDRAGGELTFDTRPGEGTTFSVRLPLIAVVTVPVPA
jgi:PAS domain S-box-containing protein